MLMKKTGSGAEEKELLSVGHMKACSLPRPLTYRKQKPEAIGEEVGNIPLPMSQTKIYYF